MGNPRINCEDCKRLVEHSKTKLEICINCEHFFNGELCSCQHKDEDKIETLDEARDESKKFLGMAINKFQDADMPDVLYKLEKIFVDLV